MSKSGGLLITLEGIDGCGKSTQAELLHKRLAEHNYAYLPVREPGGTALGEDIRKILLHNQYSPSLQAELLLYMAARSELSEKVILPAIKSGKIVLCDRFTDSTLAYQGYGGGADLSLITLLNNRATYGLRPDMTLLLDLPVEEAAGRRNASADRMESKDLNYHKRVRCGYLEIAGRDPQRVQVINASVAVEEQGNLIWNLVQGLINRKKATRSAYEF